MAVTTKVFHPMALRSLIITPAPLPPLFHRLPPAKSRLSESDSMHSTYPLYRRSHPLNPNPWERGKDMRQCIAVQPPATPTPFTFSSFIHPPCTSPPPHLI